MTGHDHGRLTAAAELALEEYLSSTREEILVTAANITSRESLGSAELPISLSELLDAIGLVRQREQEELRRREGGELSYRGRRLRRVLELYRAVGQVCLVLAALFIVGSRHSFEIGTNVLATAGFALAVAGAGFFIFATAVPVDRIARTHDRREPETSARPALADPYLLLRRFADLEVSLRDAVAALAGESVAAGPISKLVGVMQDRGVWDNFDAEVFGRLLGARNELAHRGDAEIAGPELSGLMSSARYLIAKTTEAADTPYNG